jgi:hypothetical protein
MVRLEPQESLKSLSFWTMCPLYIRPFLILNQLMIQIRYRSCLNFLAIIARTLLVQTQ